MTNSNKDNNLSSGTPPLQQRCEGEIWPQGMNFPRPYRCKHKASVERNGKHFCGIHDPERRKAKQDPRAERFNAEMQQRMAAATRTSLCVAAASALQRYEGDLPKALDDYREQLRASTKALA